MLSWIELENFKCFGNLRLECKALNLLCGLNGTGKSSLIQALLILHQSFQSGDLLDGKLLLSDNIVDIGTGADILFQDAAEDAVGFSLGNLALERPWQLRFHYTRTADALSAEPKRPNRPPSYVPMEWRSKPPFGGLVIYVGAERLGPRKLHTRSESMARRRNLGVHGEYALSFLSEHAPDALPEGDARIRTGGRAKLLDVLDDWLQEVTPGAHLGWEEVPSADAIVAGFEFDRSGDVRSRRYRATNVGFGLSYVLPVLLALLSPPSSLVLIENPEAHLHPRGQTKLGELAARAAIMGVQLFVETHSDHFMDGVRIAVRDRLIPKESISFNYFDRGPRGSCVYVPSVDDNGRLSEWPRGFFDQHEENLTRLLAPRSE